MNRHLTVVHRSAARHETTTNFAAITKWSPLNVGFGYPIEDI